MPGRLIFAIMRAMAEHRRQRILAELAVGPVLLSELANRTDLPVPTIQEDITLMDELGLVRIEDEVDDPEIRVGPHAEVELSTDRVQFRLRSPDEEEIKLTRRRGLFPGL